MIKAEQIPKEVEDALMHSLIFSGKDGAEALAAAINAWPGVGHHLKRNGWEKDFISLPLTQEEGE
jgi:hypothetical protein